MTFHEAVLLVAGGNVVKRDGWPDGVQMSLSKDNKTLIKYHVAACELPLLVSDILANDWLDKNGYT